MSISLSSDAKLEAWNFNKVIIIIMSSISTLKLFKDSQEFSRHVQTL